jgi:gliding motility-associated-like protein
MAVLGAALALNGYATHIVGGEITYEKLSGNSYEITLSVYRDCGPTNTNGTYFDDPAAVAVYNDGGGLVQNLSLSLVFSQVELVPVVLENPCFVLPPDVCVERAVYTATVNLPPVPGGYVVVYQRCCRNPSIVNLDFPQDTGATFFAEIPGSEITTANSSPVYTNWPPVALCAGGAFWFDHSATDADGDSLVYEFCAPLHGGDPDFPAPNPPSAPPYTPVNWGAGYSATYPIDSSPAFTIDPQTGYMQGTPTSPGQYVVGICVSEYRNGVYLSTTRRDFQFNVTICDPNIIAAIPEQTEFCDGLTLEFANESTNASFYHWDFGVEGIVSDTSNLFEPTFTYPDTGVYTITLIANPGWPCADTAYSVYASLPVIAPDIVVDGFDCVNNGVLFNFSALTLGGGTLQYLWDFGPGASPQFSTAAAPTGIDLNEEDDQILVTLTVSDGDCEEYATEEVVIAPAPEAVIVPQESFCDGLLYVFEQTSANAETFYWDFGTPLDNDFSFLSSPSFLFPDTGHFTITLVASAPFACADTAYMDFEIYGLLNPSFPEQDPQCLEGNSFSFQGLGATTSTAAYAWNFGLDAVPSTSAAPNPVDITFSTAGTYLVTLQISENGCEEYVEDLVYVFNDPTIDFSFNTAEGCVPLGVSFNAMATADTQLFYDWNFGDGNTSVVEDPVNYYQLPGQFDITLTVYTVNGCIASETMTIEDAVQVRPLPVAGFTADPTQVDILNPLVNVTDQSQFAIDCQYYTSDGGQYTDCDFQHAFSQSGYQWIHQYVTNEYGCVNDVVQYIIVNGFVFYAPNAFTPDGDGINDIWVPVLSGWTTYELSIFNRWGDRVFHTLDASEPWLGDAHNGSHFARDEVYTYYIRFSDLLGLPHEYTGHITLLR